MDYHCQTNGEHENMISTRTKIGQFEIIERDIRRAAPKDIKINMYKNYRSVCKRQTHSFSTTTQV